MRNDRVAEYEKTRARRRNDPEFARRERQSRLKYRDANRDAINALTRKRYETDEEFRERVKAYGEEFRERLANGYLPEWPPVYMVPKGRKRKKRMYRQSEMCRMLGCAPITYRRWLSGGWVPEATHWHRGRRVFTKRQIDLLGYFYEQNYHDHDARSKASKCIFERWDK